MINDEKTVKLDLTKPDPKDLFKQYEIEKKNRMLTNIQIAIGVIAFVLIVLILWS